MSNTGGKVANAFRESFPEISKHALKWFPSHMGKGIKEMQNQLKNIDCIIEVHDARVPLSGHYADYSRTLTGLKPHILALNKKDLTDMRFAKQVRLELKNKGYSNVFYTNFKTNECKATRSLLPAAIDLIKNSERYNRWHESANQIMIIGVPNVGKSSLINRWRNTSLKIRSGIQVGNVAGITRSVSTRIKVSEDPLVYVLDTPGILAPTITNVENGLKLALVGCLLDHLVGPQLLADYLLFWLNKHQHFRYAEKIGLDGPSDNITYVLTFIAAKEQLTSKIRMYDGTFKELPNLDIAASNFLNRFRRGEFGLYCLDQNILIPSKHSIVEK